MLPALWRLARRTPRVTLAVALGVALLGVMWLTGRSAPRGTAPAPGNPLGEGRLLTPEVELRGVVRQLQEDTAVLRKSLDDVTRALQELREKKGPVGDAALSAKELERLKRELGPLPPPPIPVAAPAPAPPPPAPVPTVAPPPDTPRITVFTVGKPAPAAPAPPARWVHLPAGSFVKATLLSGVYAPTRAQQPLPVLLHFTEAPVGPNATRVPLARVRGGGAGARRLHHEAGRPPARHDELRPALRPGRQPARDRVGGGPRRRLRDAGRARRAGGPVPRAGVAGRVPPRRVGGVRRRADHDEHRGPREHDDDDHRQRGPLRRALGPRQQRQPHGRLLRAAARVAGAGHLRAERAHGIRRHPGRRDARRRRDRAPARAHGRRPHGHGLD